MDMKRKILTESLMCVHLCMNKQSDCSVFANIFRHISENMNNLLFSCVDLLIENKVELLFVHLFLYCFVHVAFRPTWRNCHKSIKRLSVQNEQIHLRATAVDKCCFCVSRFEPGVSLSPKESVFTPLFFLLFVFSGFLALNSGDHCQMGKRLHTEKERPDSIRKWQLFSCARGAGQLPGLVAKVTGSAASWCSGQPLGLMGGLTTVGILDGRSWWKAVMEGV